MGMELDVIKPEQVAAAILDGKQLPAVEDPELVAYSIRKRILEADTVDAILASLETDGWANLAGVPIQVDAVAWRPSTFKDGLPVYAVVTGTNLTTKQPVTVTTSGGTVMAALFRLDQLNAWPLALMVEKGKANADGNAPLLLKRAAGVQLVAPADHGGALDDEPIAATA